MLRRLRIFQGIALIVCAAAPVLAQPQPPAPSVAQVPAITEPEVSMKFSSGRILLGEPIWVLVTAHNSSDTGVKWNPGDYCFMSSTMPVTAVVPEAAPGKSKPEPCQYGLPGGNCMMGGSTTTLAPGTSATWRFLLEGDFHFAHAGTYRVQLTLHPGKAFGATKDSAPALPVTQTLTLDVMPKDDAALLTREKQMAAEMEAEMLPAKRAPISADRGEREASFRESTNIRRVRGGLAAEPALGMEAVFEHWLQLPNDFWGDAITGLKNLNTKESRAALAAITKMPVKPHDYAQRSAVYALDETGDREYLPLMIELSASTDQEVRRGAIRGLGDIGGEAGVAKLLEIAKTGESVERGDALTALGRTDSRAAVKALIDMQNDPTFGDAEWPLFELTHHRLPASVMPRTPQQTHDAWLQWWSDGGKKDPVYSQFECAPKEALSQ